MGHGVPRRDGGRPSGSLSCTRGGNSGSQRGFWGSFPNEFGLPEETEGPYEGLGGHLGSVLRDGVTLGVSKEAGGTPTALGSALWGGFGV